MPRLSPKYQLPADPQVRIFDILAFIGTMDPERGELVDCGTVAGMFQITRHDACVRLAKLRKWGLIRAVKRGRPMLYGLTTWGWRYLQDQGYTSMKKEE